MLGLFACGRRPADAAAAYRFSAATLRTAQMHMHEHRHSHQQACLLPLQMYPNAPTAGGLHTGNTVPATTGDAPGTLHTGAHAPCSTFSEPQIRSGAALLLPVLTRRAAGWSAAPVEPGTFANGQLQSSPGAPRHGADLRCMMHGCRRPGGEAKARRHVRRPQGPRGRGGWRRRPRRRLCGERRGSHRPGHLAAPDRHREPPYLCSSVMMHLCSFSFPVVTIRCLCSRRATRSHRTAQPNRSNRQAANLKLLRSAWGCSA